MTLRQFVDVTSTNAARIFGLYPRKGVIAVGQRRGPGAAGYASAAASDTADFHVADYSPWEGWEVSGWPTTTILRGKVMAHNGELQGKPGDGQWLPRKIEAPILERVAL